MSTRLRDTLHIRTVDGFPAHPEDMREPVTVQLQTGGDLPEVWLDQDADTVSIHPDQLDTMIQTLVELRLIWKRSRSDLYREPGTRGDA